MLRSDRFPTCSLVSSDGPAPDAGRAPLSPPQAEPPFLPAPRTLADTGLSHRLLTELLLKQLYMGGRTHFRRIAERLKLSANVLLELFDFVVRERLAEVGRRGEHDTDVEYQLTDIGKAQAAASLMRCRYAGPAPVALEAYCAAVLRQSVRLHGIARADTARALEDLLLEPSLRDHVGSAVNSGRPMYLFGPPGSGKTTLALRLAALVPGDVCVPYALAVDDDIVVLHDPLLHIAAERKAPDGGDGRWALCRRPVVHTGCELTMDMLALRYDETAGYYHAPLQLKANNGVFVVDDVGRHRMPLPELAGRWLAPLERGSDRMLLRSGYQFAAPFDAALIFAGRADPAALGDDTFSRRMAYKIRLGDLTRERYCAVVRAQCEALGVDYGQAAFDHLVDALHASAGRPLLAVYPRELLGLIADHARYLGQPAVMSVPAVERAWRMYFMAQGTLAQCNVALGSPAHDAAVDPVDRLSEEGAI